MSIQGNGQEIGHDGVSDEDLLAQARLAKLPPTPSSSDLLLQNRILCGRVPFQYVIAQAEQLTPSYRFVFRLSYQRETHLSIKYCSLNVSFSPASIRGHFIKIDPEP